MTFCSFSTTVLAATIGSPQVHSMHFCFQEEDEGPYFLSDAGKQQKKFNTATDRLLSKSKTKKAELVGRGFLDVLVQLPMTLAELQAKAPNTKST